MINESLSDLFALGVILKKMLTPVEKTDAYKLGLIDEKYKIMRKPTTKEERQALSLMNKFVFKLKRHLGHKVSLFSTFLLLMNQEIDGDIILESKQISKLEKTFVLWNEQGGIGPHGYVGSKQAISKFYHRPEFYNKRFYSYYPFNEFIIYYGFSKMAGLKAVDKDGNIFSDINEAL